MIYTDSAGARGAQVAALVPVRRGWHGTVPVPGWTGSLEWSASNRSGERLAPPPASAASLILETARLHPDRADALLQKLAAEGPAGDSLTRQRGLLVDAVAEALRDRERRAAGPVLFAHPLAVTDAARRRFNISIRAPAGAAAAPRAITFDTRDWDRSTAIDAPGQSGSPDSAHFADLAKLWADGHTFPLAFSEQAVRSHAAATLTLTPR